MKIQSEVWLREDIRQVLNAIDAANVELAANLPIREVAIYRAGFRSAVQAMATAFDVQVEPKHEANEVKLLSTDSENGLKG